MVSSSGFDSDDDFIFGVDLSNLDVSQIVDEGEASSPKEEESKCQTPDYSSRIRDLLSRTRFPALETPVTQAQYDELFSWATSIGAELDGVACMEDIYGGRGLAARKRFEVGDVVAVLPRELRMGQTMACKRLGLPSDTPDLSALSVFLLDLASSENENDYFLNYVRCLPRKGSNGLFLNNDDVEYYGSFGEKYSKAIKAINTQAVGCTDYIRQVLADDMPEIQKHSLATLLWAISMVQSRTHGFGTHRSRWLTAIFDFANHSPSPNCKLEGDSQGRLLLRAVEPVAPNDEITIDYQVEEDSKLLATYGFSLLHPPKDSSK